MEKNVQIINTVQLHFKLSDLLNDFAKQSLLQCFNNKVVCTMTFTYFHPEKDDLSHVSSDHPICT